jgi:hypothetical protein
VKTSIVSTIQTHGYVDNSSLEYIGSDKDGSPSEDRM